MKRTFTTVGLLIFGGVGLLALLHWRQASTLAGDPAPPAAADQLAGPGSAEETVASGPSSVSPAASRKGAGAEGQLPSDGRASPKSAEPLAETAAPQDQTPLAGEGAGETVGPALPILDAVSRQISFQALLKDNSGVPLAGPTVDLRFQIYTSPGGVAVGAPIDVLAVPVANGVVDTQVPVPGSSFDGTGRAMGVRVNLGAELTPRILLTAVPHAYRVDRVASEELDDTIALGRGVAPLASGLLNIHNGAMAQESIELNGAGHRISTYGSDGLEQIRLWGPSWGELLLNDTTGNQTTVFLSANGDSGGLLQLREGAGSNRVLLAAPTAGGTVQLNDSVGGSSLLLNGNTGSLSAEDRVDVVSSIGGTVQGSLYTNSFGAWIDANDELGTLAVRGGATNVGAGGFWFVYNGSGIATVEIDGDDESDAGVGIIEIRNAAGSNRLVLDGDSGTTNGGEISVFDADGTETIEMLGAETSIEGPSIKLFRADGTGPTIEIDGHFVSGAQPDGRIITDELQITGGSDLSEQFDVKPHRPEAKVEPGMVVCIDPNQTGKLLVSHKAYDRTVAGIISGANGVETGLYMGQRGSEEVDGQFPVALTGRVYVWCDARHGAIEAGDLLTTSDTPGHAMKVTDYARAQGAILGKAMSPLAQGKGLVLVLVTLQ